METRTLLEPIHPSRLNLLVEETRPEPRRESALAQERRMIDADLRSFFDSVSQHEVANNRPPKKFPVGKTSIQYRRDRTRADIHDGPELNGSNQRPDTPDPRNDRVCITSLCPRQFPMILTCCRQLRRRQQLRLLEPLAAHHHGPGHAYDLVSKRNGGDLDRPTVHQANEPEPLRAALARISDDSHGAGDKQPAQVSIAPLRDPAEPLFAPARVLSGHQADPRSETTARLFQSPTSATNAVATIGPTPGIS